MANFFSRFAREFWNELDSITVSFFVSALFIGAFLTLLNADVSHLFASAYLLMYFCGGTLALSGKRAAARAAESLGYPHATNGKFTNMWPEGVSIMTFLSFAIGANLFFFDNAETANIFNLFGLALIVPGLLGVRKIWNR